MASIIFYVPDQDPVEYSLEGYEQLTIGRGPESQIVLDHPSISTSHAVIQDLGGVYQLTDVGSTNGSYLDGEQFTELALYHGARPMLGHVQCEFVDESAAAPEAQAGASDPAAGGEAAASFYGTHRADLSESSARPAGFVNLSPIPKVEKKDPLAQVAIIVGIVGILAALALVAVAFTLSAS